MGLDCGCGLARACGVGLRLRIGPGLGLACGLFGVLLENGCLRAVAFLVSRRMQQTPPDASGD